MKTKDWWLKFGCFLIGYNYEMLKDCSEVSKKFVKKMTSALLIISIIWSFIGFSFSSRYLQLSFFGSLIGGLVMLIIIIQIERQIILTIKKNVGAFFIRLLLGIIVAFIGATIIDQIFFKNDIEIKKRDVISQRVDERSEKERISKNKSDSLYNLQKREIDSNINVLSKAIAIEGYTIPMGVTNSVTNTLQINAGRVDSPRTITKTQGITYGTNPKVEERNGLIKQRSNIVDTLNKNQQDFMNKLNKIQNDALNENVGFLDELKLMFKLVSDPENRVALFVYILWFLFFVFIEIFIVISKLSNETTDYERAVLFQEKSRDNTLIELEEKRRRYIGEEKVYNETIEKINKTP